MFDKSQITGTLVNYYSTCKREAWLYAHHIHADQNDENILMGKTLAQIKETRLHDFPYSHLHFDKLSKERGHYMITEYKKSLKNPHAAKMQLLFYMYILKNSLKLQKLKGKVVCKKKSLLVEDSCENFSIMQILLDELVVLVNLPKAPSINQKNICKNCAYWAYCF